MIINRAKRPDHRPSGSQTATDEPKQRREYMLTKVEVPITLSPADRNAIRTIQNIGSCPWGEIVNTKAELDYKKAMDSLGYTVVKALLLYVREHGMEG